MGNFGYIFGYCLIMAFMLGGIVGFLIEHLGRK
jgi:hypothetical protein